MPLFPPSVRRLASWLLFLGLGGPAPLAGQAGDMPVGMAGLRPGDVVQVTVWRRPELSGEFAIGTEGRPLHPLYREIVLAGIPLEEAEARMREFLSVLEANPRFVLQPLYRVAVGGEVSNPDLYSFPPGTTVSEAVALAGGATRDANLQNVLVLRDGEEHVADLTRPHAGIAAETVRSRDQIVVERRTSVLRDYVVPIASITGALVSLLALAVR